MGARRLIVCRCQTPLSGSRHGAGFKIQVTLHLARLDSLHRGRRRTPDVTNYESVGADIADARATQQRKLVSRSKIDLYRIGISLGMCADS